jgi:hypothetical protein
MLGLWAGDGNEGAKFWLQILTQLKTRGVADTCIAVCDGIKGLPDAIPARKCLYLTTRSLDPTYPGQRDRAGRVVVVAACMP